MRTYSELLTSKEARAAAVGMSSTPDLAPHLFDFQADCVDFLLRIEDYDGSEDVEEEGDFNGWL